MGLAEPIDLIAVGSALSEMGSQWRVQAEE